MASKTTKTAHDLIGYEGNQYIRIVGARAHWTTAKAATRGENVILVWDRDGKVIRKSVAPATPVELVKADEPKTEPSKPVRRRSTKAKAA